MLLTTSTDPLIGASTEIEMDTDFFKLFRVRHLGIFLRCDLDLFCVWECHLEQCVCFLSIQ